MTAFFLNPARFRWLDRMAVPRFLRIIPLFREHTGHHRVIPVPPPRHASGERVSAGGVLLGTLPRREPGDTRVHLIDRGPGKPPFLTGAQAVLAGETRPPVNDDAETLALYMGNYGVRPQLQAAMADRMARAS